MSRELEESRETVTCSVCVELFKDSRMLNCSHSFCLSCLIGCQAQAGQDGATEIACPVCRELTIPPLTDIPLLPSNVFADKVAELIRTNDETAYTPQSEADQDVNTEASELFAGNLLPEHDVAEERSPLFNSNTAGSIAISLLLAIAIAMSFSFHYMSVVLSVVIALIGLYSALRVEKHNMKHHSDVFACNGCNTRIISVLRYRCGMCNDFMLCPECFKIGDNLSQRHHIFVKLKFKQRRELPLGPVLKPQAFSLAETFDYSNSTHGRAYIHHPDRLLRVPGIKCAFCGAMPIRGLRFKCGMCNNYDLCSQCENFSHKIHDKSHVFMVLKHKAEVNFVSEPLLRAHFY